ncbi:DUF192 domain-containing protein [Rhodocyclus tenuis]|uniref:DUF192 domain-containing protein n=1 Tax=Rhodocyclus gracilis TaxID=2929842 RepID=A0ABX0WLP2_9RHOO|nr:DUF192 domain-containing protein [Rhodocyclus gracilis]NJA89671.1 DUF192 domain-containing protein [Rhodocyclus gracilis]
MRTVIFWHRLGGVVSLVALAFGLTSAQAAEFPQIELSAGIHRIEAEVASDQATRMQGLMYRRTLATEQGMLFVFPQRARHCMWMRNTLLPLSVAFLDEEGRIINIEDMQPQTENNHCAAQPARFALEMNLGWFASRSLGPGMRIVGVERSPAPQ